MFLNNKFFLLHEIIDPKDCRGNTSHLLKEQDEILEEEDKFEIEYVLESILNRIGVIQMLLFVFTDCNHNINTIRALFNKAL